MGNLGKMLHVCRRKALGMEIKVIFMQHGSAIICRLARLSACGAVVEMWAFPLGSSVAQSAPSSSDRVTAAGVRGGWKITSHVLVPQSPFRSFLGKISIIQF